MVSLAYPICICVRLYLEEQFLGWDYGMWILKVEDWVHSSVVEHLPSMYEAMSLISSTPH
jgi:hypothetical protein